MSVRLGWIAFENVGVCVRLPSALRTTETGLSSSVSQDGWPEWQEFRHFPEVLGGGGEVELVAGAVWSAQSQAIEPEDALEVREQHLDLLALAS